MMSFSALYCRCFAHRTLIRGLALIRRIESGYQLGTDESTVMTTTLTNFTLTEVTMIDRIYQWLFSEEERTPIGFIPLFFMIIVISTVVCLFILSVSRAIMWI